MSMFCCILLYICCLHVNSFDIHRTLVDVVTFDLILIFYIAVIQSAY